jgi:hypothetical protein
MGTAMEKLGTQEINVRSRILEAFRVLAFPLGASAAQYGLWDSSADAGPGLECFRIDFGETSPATSPRRGARVRDAVAEAPILEALRGQGKLVPEAAVDNPVVLAPQVVRQRPAWSPDERRISTQDVWDRFRRNPDLPMLLRQTDLLPTLRAGLTTVPEALWSYYDQGSKRVYTRESASSVAPVLSATHFLYDLGAAFEDRIIPVTSVAPSEIWDYLWP